MTGPEHYLQAELLLESCQTAIGKDETECYPDGEAENALAAAQVHATLALAAATAFGDSATWSEWAEAVSSS